ncbi:Cilia- and flagella-associated protein 251 [Irineochytrium annulatum]|nr:Cilia- and flagella-associated protein 251 [Irineochytrium annulatum]
MPQLGIHASPMQSREQTPGGMSGGVGGSPSLTVGFQAINAMPIKTLFEIHDGTGVVAAEFSADSRYLVTLGNEAEQTLAIWDWTTDSDVPIASVKIEGEQQKCVKLNPEDPTEILTNGNLSVIFMIWDKETNVITQHVPRLSSKDFKHNPTSFTYSAFIPTTNQSVTTTGDGDVIIWTDRSLNNLSVPLERGKKAAIKFMKLHTGSINFLVAINKKYLITGGDDGYVKIFDLQIWDFALKKLLAVRKFEDVKSTELVPMPEDGGPFQQLKFNFADPISGKIPATAAKHSSDAADKERKAHKKGHKEAPPDLLKIETLAYSHDGNLIAIGFSNGTVRVVFAADLKEFDGPRNPQGIKLASFWSIAKAPVVIAAFSPCGNYLAFADGGFAVTLFKKELKVGPKKEVQGRGEAVDRLAAGTLTIHWAMIGRCQAHFKEIICTQHRHVAEYDLPASTITGGIKLRSLKKIEQSPVPLAATLYPRNNGSGPRVTSEGDPAPTTAPSAVNPSTQGSLISLDPAVADPNFPSDAFLMTANTDFKMKLHNVSTQLCRKTVLGPTFGGQITHLTIVPELAGPPKYAAFSTKEKVVGLIKLPFDGNPHGSMGLIAHPCAISNITTTCDGSYLLTAGVEDGVVHMWSMYPAALEAQILVGGRGLEPFLNMLEPSGKGVEGPIYREMEDYFYYAQLRTQGEDAAGARVIQDTVEIGEVPSIMQAMGFYPSGQEIEDMLNEVKFSKVEEGQLVEAITFDDLIKLFVNHRPVFDYTENDLFKSLLQAVKQEPGRNPSSVPSKLQHNDTVTKDGLLALLQQYGV